MRWLKIWVKETLYGTTFQELNAAERGVWFSLLLMAGSKRNLGIVEARDGVAFSIKQLAFVLNLHPKSLSSGLKTLQSVGKINILEDGRIQIINWEKYQTAYMKKMAAARENNEEY